MTDAVMTSPDKSGIKGEHPKLRHVLGHDLWRRRIPSKIVSSAAVKGNSGHSAVPPVITLFLWHPVSFGGHRGGRCGGILQLIDGLVVDGQVLLQGVQVGGHIANRVVDLMRHARRQLAQ